MSTRMHHLAMAAASAALAVGGALALAPSAQAVSPPLAKATCSYDGSGGVAFYGETSQSLLGDNYKCTLYGWERTWRFIQKP
jgi:hypothetical protein